MGHSDQHSSNTIHHIRQAKEKETIGLAAEDVRRRLRCTLKTGTHGGWLYEQGKIFKNVVAIAYDSPRAAWIFSLLFIDWFVHSFIHFFFFYSLTTKLNIKFLLRCWEILKRAWVNGETSCVHCLGDLISLRWYAPQIVVQTQSNPYQNSSFLLCRSWQANFKIHMKIEGIKNSHNNLGGGGSRRLTLPNFKTYYKTIGIKQCGTSLRIHVVQWDGFESLEINLYIYDQLIFSVGVKTFNGGKNSFSTYDARTSGYPHAKDWSWTSNSDHI